MAPESKIRELLVRGEFLMLSPAWRPEPVGCDG